MEHNRHLIRLAAGLATLVLGVVACQGAPSSSIPPGASSFVTQQAHSAGILPDKKKKDIDLVSTCGTRLHIVLLGIVDCQFNEKDYNGKFKVSNKTKGLVTITPSSGTRGTTFTVVGALVGSGTFTVSDNDGNHLILRVKVTL